MHAVDEKVTPTALRGFHFDLALFDEDGDGNEDSEVSLQSYVPVVGLLVLLSSKCFEHSHKVSAWD